jgi:hypothetical protein
MTAVLEIGVLYTEQPTIGTTHFLASVVRTKVEEQTEQVKNVFVKLDPA